MTALSFEGGFDFGTEVNHNEYPSNSNHHPQTRAVSGKPPPRKRRRIVISCTECHRRKQKCDRKLPCTNCISRQRQDDCQYDSGAPTAKEQQRHQQPKRAQRTSSNGISLTSPEPGADGSMDNIAEEQWSGKSSTNDNDHLNLPSNVSNVANLGYSTTGASTSTIGFLHKIENHSNSSSSPHSYPPLPPCNGGDRASTSANDVVNRYKSLIRLLPQRPYVEKLVDSYFHNFNWQYYMLDRDIFDKQVEEWYKIPFDVFNNGGPGAILPDLRVFPALLFQVVSIGMLVLPEKAGKGGRGDVKTGHGNGMGNGKEDKRAGTEGQKGQGDSAGVDFEALKYAGSMTFEDLATEYSESGVAIVSLLGKRQMTLTTVLAGFVRASFLKFIGMVPEAWHAIGTAIRDAQELGLHRSSFEPRPPPSASAEAILQNQWEIQRRRKVWLNLVTWDIHCGATLGRPSTIDLTSNPPILPIDVALPITFTNFRSPTPLIPRSEDDPPTPLTRILFSYKITLQLVSILSLEKEGASPASFSKIDTLHQSLLDLENSIPPYFRLQDPDTRFDSLQQCYWLPWARALLPQLTAFNFMALHRPYIFTRPLSRQLAVEKGCLAMLRAQRRHWEMLSREMRMKTFTLFFGTFDAVVLMGAVYILFSPIQREKGDERMTEMVEEVVQQFKWAEERFEEMRERNPLARQARGVVRGVGERLGRALGEVSGELSGNGKGDGLISEGREGLVKTSVVAVTGRGKRPVRQELIKPVISTGNGLSPVFSTSASVHQPGTGTVSRGMSSLTTPGFPTPESTAPSSLAQGQFSSATSDLNTNTNTTITNIFDTSPFAFDNTSSIPIDLCLDTADDVHWAAASITPSSISLPSLPEDFNWTNISPIYATGDLVYNDLTGFMYDGFDSVLYSSNAYLVQGGGGGGYRDGVGLDARAQLATETQTQTHIVTGAGTGTQSAGNAECHGGMGELMGHDHEGNEGNESQNEALWMFGARGVREGTCVWGLLNRY
ncbi:hypothetical protein B0T09DRAFT_27174 [Sordaria sp. MPI-SDFR-AT-0083]|nr:hypothetical protein B0T09DRAFT_27174 [Sordaria sp. MPI-SDFR-AT-0083]